jgi:transcriptional regulator with XRE-family HTH domain
MSQAQLAEATGLKQPNIARIEAGKYSTTLDLLTTIADALGVKVDFI